MSNNISSTETNYSTSLNNYIYNKNPSSYGKGNDYFKEQTLKSVDHAVSIIKENVSKERDLEKTFFSLFDFFCEKRREISQKTQTEDADHFGRRRDSVEGISDGHAYTVLSKKYEQYGDRMVKLLQNKLATMPRDLEGFEKPTLKEDSECMERKSSFEVEVIDAQSLAKKGWNRDIDLIEVMKVCGDAPDIKEKVKRLKTKRPDLYKQDKMFFFLKSISKVFPSPQLVSKNGEEPIYVGNIENLKSHWVLATSRIEINNKMYALSQYLTYMYCNHRTDPVERMSGKSKITIIHQDALLIDTTLKEVAKIFKEALQWDEKEGELSDLKKRVGLLRYIFAHAMPTNRGSAAIGEWFEKSIFRYHGYDETHSHNGTVDLDALTSDSLSVFMEKYNRALKLYRS